MAFAAGFPYFPGPITPGIKKSIPAKRRI